VPSNNNTKNTNESDSAKYSLSARLQLAFVFCEMLFL